MFKQQNLSVEQLALASTATMADLKEVLPGDRRPEEQPSEDGTDSQKYQVPSAWPPVIGEHIVVHFEDGW